MAYTGKLGDDLVIRESNGQSIMYPKPQPKKKRKLSLAERTQQRNFRISARRASIAIRDPEKRPAYEAAREPGQTAYNMAFRESMFELTGGRYKQKTKPVTRKTAPPAHSRGKLKIKDISVLLDTNIGTVFVDNIPIPDRSLKWILTAAKKSTPHQVKRIVLRINCD